MSHPDYEKIGTPEDKVIEECAELIKAIMKARRFGYFNRPPNLIESKFQFTRSDNNMDAIRREMDDVIKKFNEYEKHLMMISHEHFKQLEEEERFKKIEKEFYR